MSRSATSPVVVLHKLDGQAPSIFRYMPAALGSILCHGLLIGTLVLILKDPPPAPALEDNPAASVSADPVDETKTDNFTSDEVNDGSFDTTRDISSPSDRREPITIPGETNPIDRVGIHGGADVPPTSMPFAPGWGDKQGGALDGPNGTVKSWGPPGGEVWGGKLRPGGIDGRVGSAKEWALTKGGGSPESEAAVARGLRWLVDHQHGEGKWLLDDPRFKDRGAANDIAGTAFGLLPFLGAGKTHKASKDNGYDKPIEKALLYLIRRQNKRTGEFPGGMYAHGLATIALCEAYALSQDPILRRPSQLAINFIVGAQHDGGGWRYTPGQAGDTSVVGWQVMALKSAQMAGLDVPDVTLRKAQKYLDSCCGADEGYGYLGIGSTPAMSAVGLLSRQYLQAWGPQNPRLIKGVEAQILTNPPDVKNMYYSYYATQVLHHFGGDTWKKWNNKMRDALIASQDTGTGAMRGSWSPAGDPHGPAGGRLMQTSLSLLTLEVYYRHLPLYYREADLNKMAGR